MSDTKVITGKVRFSYASVFKPIAMEGEETAKYSVSILIPKEDTDTIDKINKAVEAAKKLGVGKFGGKIPSVLKTPLRDGDEERPEDEAYEGMLFLNAKSNSKPGIIDIKGKFILENKENALLSDREDASDEEFYSGCWGKASINFYAYNVKNKGIACGLNNLLKLEDGDRLSGSDTALNDFEDDIDALLN